MSSDYAHTRSKQSYGRFTDRPPKHLSENRSQALKELLNTPQSKNKVEEEKIFFLLYLNYAVNNIVELTKISKDLLQEDKIHSELLMLDDAKIQALANFFWLFNVDDPQRDFPDYRKKAIMLAEKIYALRNLFAHPEKGGIDAFLVDRDFYVFLEGILLSSAQDHALSEGMKTDKLFKLKLVNKHLTDEDATKNPQKAYELTRKGIIFLTCLALYRDDAMEFCSLFEDMKLPTRCPSGLDPEECPGGSCKELNKNCNVAKAKALREMFTCFSCRKGRDVLDATNMNYMCFADIITYLNKVPTPALDYLTLEKERGFLQKLAEESTEIEENKEYKYSLHRRFKDRFLSFAAAYCEDFNLLPAMRFKRLDISEQIGRKRYCFGTENDNTNRMNRHYTISRNAIAFEFCPEEHYGPVKIGSLRSAVSEDEFKKLLIIGEKIGFENLNARIREYFTAYHRVLESLLNEADLNEVYLNKGTYFQDFCTVTGSLAGDLAENFELAPYFSANIARFFTGDDGQMGSEDMVDAIYNRYVTLGNQAREYIKNAEVLRDWRRLEPDPETGKRPSCKVKLGDGAMINRVFDLFNLYLPANRKFRQLPLGEQHNPGMRDHEFQLVHRAIGKYSLDQKGMTVLVKKIRPELEKVVDQLEAKANKWLNEEKKYLDKHPRYDRNGKPARASKTLFMLAAAAAELFEEFCAKKLDTLENMDPYSVSAAELRAECRKVGVRPGMPLDRESLIKSILNIDLEKWTHAYNYEAKAPYVNRKLEDTLHVAVGIPFPNGFAERLARANGQAAWAKGLFLENGKFDFGKAIRQRLSNELSLRDYYDVSPMIAFMKNGGSAQVPGLFDPEKEKLAAKMEGRTPREIVLSKGAVDKACRQIRSIELQDRLLLNMALKYRENYMKQGNGAFQEKARAARGTTIYTFFDTTATVGLEGGIKLQIYPNDLTRPAYSLIRSKTNAQAIAKAIDPARKEFTFYEMQEALRRIQSADRRKRLEIIPKLTEFEARVSLPALSYTKDQKQNQNRKLEYPYFKQAFRSLTEQQFDVLVDIRNAVYHNGIALDITEAMEILKSLLSQPKFR